MEGVAREGLDVGHFSHFLTPVDDLEADEG